MMHTWKMIGLRTLVAGLLTAVPALAETSGPPTTSEKLDSIQKQLDEMKKALDGFRDALAPLKTVQKDLEDLTAQSNLKGQTVQGQISDLQRQINQLRSDLEALRDRVGSGTRTARFGPAETVPPSGTARVEMVNSYPEEVAIRVNQTAYHVPPGQARLSEPIPAGPFTYEVLGVTAPATRTVAANRVYTIYVHLP